MPITANHSSPSHTRTPASTSVMPRRRGGVGAEHDGRQLRRGGVEEAAVGELAADGVEHVDVGGGDEDAAGHRVVDEVGAPHRRRDRRDPGRLA